MFGSEGEDDVRHPERERDTECDCTSSRAIHIIYPIYTLSIISVSTSTETG